MAALVRRDLDWTTHAALAIEGRASSTASPEAVFSVLADHVRWTEWFPNVKRVEVLGPAEGVGARRRVSVPGLTVDEEFIAWEPGARWSFTGYAAKPGVLRSLVEDCKLTARSDGGTDISYTMSLDPKPLLRPVISLASGGVRRSITKAARNLAERAARG